MSDLTLTRTEDFEDGQKYLILLEWKNGIKSWQLFNCGKLGLFFFPDNARVSKAYKMPDQGLINYYPQS